MKLLVVHMIVPHLAVHCSCKSHQPLPHPLDPTIVINNIRKSL